MAVSAARVLRSNAAAALQEERPLAKVIPFQARKRDPLEEQISGRTNAQAISFPAQDNPREKPSGRPGAQVIAFPAQDTNPISKPAKSHDAETCQGIKIESSRDAKTKGQTRRSEAPPDIHYILAWQVWFKYVEIFLSMGIRVSEFLKRIEFHDQMKRGR